jgi:hypothetical protein
VSVGLGWRLQGISSRSNAMQLISLIDSYSPRALLASLEAIVLCVCELDVVECRYG